ncbi:hepatitis A virus cellular receptor 1 homolog [Hyla sarda]|uniref:hepatitis A virus cellular receptor 1 homolog n=1 Tax=Hyla sarda TaxID=327740 RepID=UPI0024C226FE|nr:hepatitis A virus cellular receptor 1 homolog [Hyla sarda]
MCWGRGDCPQFACNDTIIWTFGHTLTKSESYRYQLLGNIRQGDVSLTITGATKEDEGTYCCRVKIKRPFDDLKKEIVIKILEPMENLEDRKLTVNRSTEEMTVKDSVDSREKNFPSSANIIRGIIIILFPPLFLLIYIFRFG